MRHGILANCGACARLNPFIFSILRRTRPRAVLL